MRHLCEDIKANVGEVIDRWDALVRQEPWFSLPREHRVDHLPGVIIGLAEAALCDPASPEAHRGKVVQACHHGQMRRAQGVPDSLLFTEFHLLRQALWYYLVETHGSSDTTVGAIMRIDRAITTATNASMWGYYRDEVEAMGKWDESVDRLVASSPILREYTEGRPGP